MGKQPDSEDRNGGRGQATSQVVEKSERGAKLCHAAVGPGLSLGCSGDECAQAVLGPRQHSNFLETSYSKIHCFAAALSLASSPSLPASEYTRTTGSVPESR